MTSAAAGVFTADQLEAVVVDVESGTPLTEALAAVTSELAPRVMRPTDTAGGVTVIDDTAGADYDGTCASLRALAQFAKATGRRAVAVLGPVADADRDEQYAIGRLVVRLNIEQLVVVGQDARLIYSAAGLEGSWDGESVIVDDPQQAYALLRADIREGDIVLVKSTSGLGSLSDRLAGASTEVAL